jgi:hypothetical protein
MTFTESNTVEPRLFDTVANLGGMQASVLHWHTLLSESAL